MPTRGSILQQFAMLSARCVHAGVGLHRGGAAKTVPFPRFFDQAVQSKTDQGHGPCDESSDDGDETFSTVVGDCEEFELLASADEVLPVV